MLLTSGSADEFVPQLGTLDAIAGHTNDVRSPRSPPPPTQAEQAQADGRPRPRPQAQKAYDDIAAQQKDLEAKIADYQRQYAALTAAAAAAGRRARTATPSRRRRPAAVVAASGAAQKAVDTALAQVGDPYVWGAAGPDAFDCSGLMQYAYSAAGVSLPHSSASQSRMGTPGLPRPAAAR